jgi:hypothetical protein
MHSPFRRSVKKTTLWSVTALCCLLLASGCKKDNNDENNNPPPASALTSTYSSDVATQWLTKTYNLVKADSLKPPAASRVYGYAGVALYAAVVSGMPDYNSPNGILNELSGVPQAESTLEYHWPTVANCALAAVLDSLLPSYSQPEIAALHDQLAAQYQASLAAEVFDRSEAFGQSVAAAIVTWAQADGYSTYHNCAYTPPTGDSMWVPTPPAYAAPLEPCWGQMRTFALLNSDECLPPPNTPFGTSDTCAFYGQANEVYNASNNCTPEDSAIVFFWADNPIQSGTPGGHSIMITTQVLRNGDFNLETAAEAYARVGVAVADAFISCWRAKYIYNLCRPITFIRNNINPTWNSLITTPNFPEYTSGHSSQSGAAAQVLTDMFGANYAFVDSTHLPPRSFNSFDDFASEAAISRLYAGIHYRDAIERGLDEGHCVGARATALPLRSNS